MDSNISFGARFIQKIPIKKYHTENKIYTQEIANFVELNPFDKRDLSALSNIVNEFDNDSYVNNMLLSANYVLRKKNTNLKPLHIFAITNQKNNYEQLNPRNVLGMVQLTDTNKQAAQIDYLQVRPKFVYSFEPREYKRVGTAIIDCLKEMYKRLKAHSSYSAKPFYKKNGFLEIDNENRIYLWCKNRY